MGAAMNNFKVGKRYKWSPQYNGERKWKNGILSKIEHEDGVDYGIFITHDNEEWRIPLDDQIKEAERGLRTKLKIIDEFPMGDD